LFLCNCKPERIEHGDFKDDGQSKKIMWPYKLEVLISESTESMTDIIKIPTANLRFLIKAEMADETGNFYI